jgi:hypothetical protein
VVGHVLVDDIDQTDTANDRAGTSSERIAIHLTGRLQVDSSNAFDA